MNASNPISMALFLDDATSAKYVTILMVVTHARAIQSLISMALVLVCILETILHDFVLRMHAY